MPNRAVLFDLDNTLHDRDGGLVAFVRDQHVRLGLPCSLEDWTARFVTLDERGRVWKDIVYARLCEEFGLEAEPDVLLADYENGFAHHVVPIVGVKVTLAALRERGWQLGLVSNGRSGFQRATLAALDIEPLDVVLISEECGFRKPDPAIFHLALERLKCEEAWFVGDDPVADIEGASNAGLRPIWFRKEADDFAALLAHLL